MNFIKDLDIIYKNLSEIKLNIFCNNFYSNICNLTDTNIFKNLICKLSDKNFYKSNYNKLDDCDCDCDYDYDYDYDCDCDCDCVSLIDLLIYNICEIENRTCCDKNYSYLLQINRLCCILQNFKKLLCQLKCFQNQNCNLISKIICLLIEILGLIENIISKIKNIECLCSSNLCCSCEISECLLCLLVEDIDLLEDKICTLAHLVLEIASLNIINCTTCTTNLCCHKKSNYNCLNDNTHLNYPDFKCNKSNDIKYFR
ncbi:hypothetical protein CHF27_001940 [Romboutsia maritimum]|uniref:Uncharacterized protein n=1 Tax=Romboutsia maritimum TaxID=2020948 RepID=A0A371IWY9_9FIRM|nr:hypothetical protein [Romboutsia maritimum]RDY24985.1 hypothetical protein CHF27_001940 [Romboutsia maritimum]